MVYEMERVDLNGLQVSELCLGCSRLTPEALKNYFDAGGNFLDTSPLYGWGDSEKIIGDFGHRDELIIGTKVGLSNVHKGLADTAIIESVHESLERLKTDYIDILWVHAWDYTQDPVEVAHVLGLLAHAGSIRHIGVCNTPAWVVSMMGLVSHIQVEYNFNNRTADLELLPMANYLNMGVLAYSPFGKGTLFEKECPVSGLARSCRDMAAMTLQWLRWKGMIPVVRMNSHLKENIAALKSELPTSPESLDALTAFPTHRYSPHDFLSSDTIRKYGVIPPEN